MFSASTDFGIGTTRNELIIPTVYKDGTYKVIINGHIHVDLKYNGDGPDWRCDLHKFIIDNNN